MERNYNMASSNEHCSKFNVETGERGEPFKDVVRRVGLE